MEENHNEQITVGELVSKMKEICGEESYSMKFMKKRVMEHFGDDVIITEINGRPNVVTFRSTAASILHKLYELPKQQDAESEKLLIIETAANLIKNYIKMMDTSRDIYPSPEDVGSVEKNLEFIPIPLRLFLRKMFVEKSNQTKIASVGQTIIQAARPRVIIAPLEMGLGVQMHHHFGSKFLIDFLNSYGFYSSYTEVKKYEV